MNEKYINIEREPCNRTQDSREALMEIVSRDIIFVLSYPDMTYDHDSEKMGDFCEVAYWQGDKIVWQEYSHLSRETVTDFIDKLGNRVTAIKKWGDFTDYIGKPREEFHTDEHDLIYQGKYRVKGNSDINFGGRFNGKSRRFYEILL